MSRDEYRLKPPLSGLDMQEQKAFARGFSGIGEAFKDFFSGFTYWRLWIALSINDLRQRYRRSWLGVTWIAISFGLFTAAKIFIFSTMTSTSDAYYAAYLTIGYLCFRFISSCVTVGSMAFVSAANWMKSEPLPIPIHIFKVLTTNTINLFFHTLPTVLICLYYGAVMPDKLFLIPVVLFIYILNGVWVITLVGLLCTRHRDMLHFTATAMSIMYFLTPILWIVPEEGPRAAFAQINPFTHYVNIIRTPLLTGDIPWDSFLIVGVITLIGFGAAVISYAASRRKLIYWL